MEEIRVTMTLGTLQHPLGAYTEVDDLHNGTSEFYKNVMGSNSRRYMCFKRERTNRRAGRWGYLSNTGKALNLTVGETPRQ